MALIKQPIEINFFQGLDTKTDPFQIQSINFLRLQNSVFNKVGQLTKRNGFNQLTSLPEDASYLATFDGNLMAIGSSLFAYAAGANVWINKGSIQPVSLSTLSLIRSNLNQTQVDTAVSPNNFICTAYTEIGPGSTSYKYSLADSITGQNILPPLAIPASGTILYAPRVFLLGNYFIILVATVNTLQYVAINSQNPVAPSSSITITSQINPEPGLNWDAVVMGNNLYISWNGSDAGGAIRTTYIDSLLNRHNTQVTLGYSAALLTCCADIINNLVYVTFWNSSNHNGYTEILDSTIVLEQSPYEIITDTLISNITAVANSGVETVLYEIPNAYAYDTSIETNYIETVQYTAPSTVTSPSVVIRSVGLATKAFMLNSDIYFTAVYQSAYQPTYFLLNLAGQVISEFAYSNGGGYHTTGLSNVSVYEQDVILGYQYADLIEAVNKSQGVANSAGVYSQTGLNAITFTFQAIPDSVEIGNTLNLTGGFLWTYDGYTPVENNFFLWPDYIEATNSVMGGGLASQQYYYQVVYQWSDNQGNIYNSAPSVPLLVDLTNNVTTPITFTGTFTAYSTSMTVNSISGLYVGQEITDSSTPGNIQDGTYITSIDGLTVNISLPTTAASGGAGDVISTADTNSVTLQIPTLRLTYKISNPVKITVFRWSVAQQNYFQVTSVEMPLLNDTSIDYVTFSDTDGDGAILGNSLIYTTGGVLEDIPGPSFNALTLFDSRLWGIDGEDSNLLWYSKQVIENTPVEMSDLLTFYTAPTTSAQGSTGKTFCIAPMDDKLLLFKRDAIYYINGIGPDNTGSNSQYSGVTIITSSVGSTNQKSIVLMQNGLMFQSDKGIWLVDRGLNTSYIGAAVEEYVLGATVLSALQIPGTNQIRFTMDSGITLMYDYFVNQWGVFVNIPGVSSVLYNDLHTFINEHSEIYQETPGAYLDGSNPVLQGFTTAWLKVSGLQGFQRAYYLNLLGTYFSPHKLTVGILYNYDSSKIQNVIVTPDNTSSNWGLVTPWGGDSVWGGETNIEQARVFFEKGKCQSIQIQVDEVFDPSYNTIAGQGLSLSGLNVTIGVKKAYPSRSAARSYG